MFISYKWLKELTDFDMSPAELDHVLTMLGIEVEHIIDYSAKYRNFFVAEVLEKEKHPNADKLSVCRVNSIGGERTVVCGDPNVAAGQKVVLGIPGAVVPSNGMTLEKRAVRKIESDGMLCSQIELGVGDDASGLWLLPQDAPAGMPLAEFTGMDDIVLEISVTPNRADCLSHFGIAREIAAYLGNEVKYPNIDLKESEKKSSDFIKITILDGEKCPRYTGRVVRNVKVGESPEWLKRRLQLLGLRPINAIVDVTNFVLHECGQPLHAFDLDKIAGKEIIVKTANERDTFVTLDSKERKLNSQMLMICDGEKPIAVGGVMGGENSAITVETTNILIESAYFQPSSIRKTAKTLGISSDASYRFERGVDFMNIDYANNRAAQLIAEISGGEIMAGLIDVEAGKVESKIINLRYDRANKIIGANIDSSKMRDMLRRLNFDIISATGDSVTVEAPSYRVDMFEEIDLIEEIARLNDYDNLEPQFYSSFMFDRDQMASELVFPSMRTKIRQYLVENGFNEILTQNQTDPASTKDFGENYITIANPLGEELSVMRLSLVPAMLKTIERNIRLGNPNMKLFEVGKTFQPVDKEQNTFISGILEREELIIALTGKTSPLQWGVKPADYDFYDIKGVFENFASFFRYFDVSYSTAKNEFGIFSNNALTLNISGQTIGTLGELNKKYLKKFDIEVPVFILNINLKELYKIQVSEPQYSPIAPFPGSRRDLAFILDKKAVASDLAKDIKDCDDNILKSVVLFDVYEGKSIGEDKKSLAFSLFFSSNERTLLEKEIEDIVTKIIRKIETKYGAELRK